MRKVQIVLPHQAVHGMKRDPVLLAAETTVIAAPGAGMSFAHNRVPVDGNWPVADLAAGPTFNLLEE